MGMNIKNEQACRLAKQLAKLTGESLTTAVTEAVRERLARLRGERDIDRAEVCSRSGEIVRLISKNHSERSIMPSCSTMSTDSRNDCRYLRDHCHPSG